MSKMSVGSFGRLACGLMVLCISIAAAGVCVAAPAAGRSAQRISALMVSDLHLDPFYDPAKAKVLADAPVSEWEKILSGPDSPGRAEAYAALQKACGATAADSSDGLLQSSLRAMRQAAPHAQFITVSGDMIAHQFPCRFRVAVPGRSQAEYAAFVEKTIDYVMTELGKVRPGMPVYAALGNNDSGCGDYRMDAGSDFLRAAGESMLRGVPASAEKERALRDFARGGYYSVAMARPMRRTRLIVLNDMFMSRNYLTCAGKPDSAAAEAELRWLSTQLDAARAKHERVWVMGHIPPGVDIHGVALKMLEVCDGAAPQMFLRSEKLADVLVAHADVVRLGIFAHTHMDELRLLRPEDGKRGGAVAVKMVPSITPVHGNAPAFTVAQVAPGSATLVDYSVFAASDSAGSKWSKEYTYSAAYHVAAFAPREVERLVKEFARDPNAKTPASRAFIRYFYAGDTMGLIKPLWPEYVCALSNDSGKDFAKCACRSVR